MFKANTQIPETTLFSNRAKFIAISGKLSIFVSGLIFFLSLSVVYYFDIQKYWEYYGFNFDFSYPKFLISIVTLILFSLLVKTKNNVASFFYQFIYLAYLCPALVMFYLGGASVKFFAISCTGIFILIVTSWLRFRRPVLASLSKVSFLGIMLTLTLITVLSIAAFGGWRYFNLNIFRVYEFRSSAANEIPSIFGYINSPVSKVVLPLGILLGLHFKSTTGVILFVIGTVLMFGLTNHKSALVAPIVILIVYSALSRYGVRKSLNILFASLSFIMVAETIFLLAVGETSTGWFATFIVRRVFLVPPLLDNYYVQFFTEHPLIYWSTSKISFGLVNTTYDTTAPFLIGDFFFHSAEMSANAGFVGSGFSNLGFLGVILYAFVLGLILSLLNAHGRDVGHFIVICASLTVMISAITSSDLVTVFLTHGLLFLLICLSLMPRQAT